MKKDTWLGITKNMPTNCLDKQPFEGLSKELFPLLSIGKANSRKQKGQEVKQIPLIVTIYDLNPKTTHQPFHFTPYQNHSLRFYLNLTDIYHSLKPFSIKKIPNFSKVKKMIP